MPTPRSFLRVDSSPLSSLLIRGAKFNAQIAEAVTAANVSMSVSKVTEVNVTFMDPDFKVLASNIFRAGTRMDFEDHRLTINSLSLAGGQGNNPLVTLRARSYIVEALKSRTGALVMKNASPTDFVTAECRAVGAGLVGQPTGRRTQVNRDVLKTGETAGVDKPSSWTTFQRLAQELGFYCFEIAGTVYFGRPSWLIRSAALPKTEVFWNEGPEDKRMLGIPDASWSTDSETSFDFSFEVPLSRAAEFRPGKLVHPRGIPVFNQGYLIESVDFPLVGNGVVSVNATSFIDPKPQGESTETSSTSTVAPAPSAPVTTGVGSARLRDVLAGAGFKGNNLEIAVAVVMAESRANPRAEGDKTLANSKWGYSIGLFQIRSLRNPNAYGSPDNLRVASKLYDARYNAQVAYRLSSGGTNWRAWSTYTSGSYRSFYKKGHNPLVINGKTVTEVQGPKVTTRTGTKYASDFVYFALQQAGDRYNHDEVRISDPNPDSFDCSELIEWAAGRAGVYMPDYSLNQINYIAKKGGETSVATAIRTRGAVLWHPGHVAISLGNGKTIEAANSRVGVVSYNAAGRFKRGGRIPGMRY